MLISGAFLKFKNNHNEDIIATTFDGKKVIIDNIKINNGKCIEFENSVQLLNTFNVVKWFSNTIDNNDYNTKVKGLIKDVSYPYFGLNTNKKINNKPIIYLNNQ